MIAGIFHKGSGLGNQLFRYVFVRCLALDKGFEFGMQNPENFKGSSFLKLEMGKTPTILKNIYNENKIILKYANVDVRGYEFDKISNIQDDTLVDGEFQGEKYFIHRKDEIREWLKVEDLELPENLCIINFRGGEYVGGKDLFLTQKYWDNAIKNMLEVEPNIKFNVVTDDIETARKFFPNIKISHSLKDDYIKIQNAHYLILSNSSFALFPAWLNQKVKLVIAPKYWARHNVSDGYWACEYNLVNGWMYQDRNGNLQNYSECMKNLESYHNNNYCDKSPLALIPLTLKEKISKMIPTTIKLILKKITHI